MTPEEIERLLTAGETCHRAGDLEGAERNFLRVREAAPENADALQLLASLKLQRGDLESAADLLNRAITLAPRNPVARVNLAACHMRAGNAAAALPHAKMAAEVAPRAPDAWRQLVLAAEQAGRAAEAAAALGRLLELVPDDRAAAGKRVALLLALGNVDEATSAFAHFERLRPPTDEYFNLATLLCEKRHDWTGMVAAAEAWLRASPGNEQARDRLSQAYLEAGNIPAAVETYRPFVETEPVPPERALAFGRLCLISQDFRQAEHYLTAAAETLPESAEAAFSMGRLHTFLGDLEEAEKACLRAVELNPDSIHAYVQLTTLRRGRVEPVHAEAMDRLWREGKAPDAVRAMLGMALGDVNDKAGDVDKAFHFYRSANELNRAHFAREDAVYKPRAQRDRTDRLTALFSNTPKPERQAADTGPKPIFIVGMPRSGTTLVESILAAHSKVYGAGEVLFGAKLLELFLEQAKARPEVPATDIIEQYREEWRKTYLDSLPPPPNEEQIVTDKLPTNFLGVGLLVHLFPEAHFIHTSRDPLDTGWSIFRHSFPRAYSFAHRLEDIGHYYNEYLRLMAFWKAAFPDLLHTVVYEELTANPEVKSRGLVEFCGLEWETDCLAFHEKKRPIATFSSVQVRSPISSSSIGAAERYRHHLGPLIDALGRSGQD